MNTAYLKRPIWRDDVEVEETSVGFRVRQRGGDCLVESCQPSRGPLRRLFTTLRRGIDTQALERDYGDFAEYAVDVIDQLDRFGYLTDAATVRTPRTISARSFRRRLEQVIEATRRRAQCPFAEALLSGRATREQLICYAVEYLHIVRHAPALIAPVLNWPWQPTLRKQLAAFIADEWRHDRLIVRSLAAAQVDTDAVAPSSILPETFAVLAQLGVRATADPLALAALLYLIERPNPTFHEAFARSCRTVDLPTAFTSPILQHAEMNDGEHHDEIATAMIRAICPVSRERADAALSDALIGVEHLIRLDKAIAAFQCSSPSHAS
jgi:hypothetical protein